LKLPSTSTVAGVDFLQNAKGVHALEILPAERLHLFRLLRRAGAALSDDIAVLLIDFAEARLGPLATALADLGPLLARGRAEALGLLRQDKPLVVVTDAGRRDRRGHYQGLDTLTALLALEPTSRVILITAGHDAELSLQAIGLGAWDVLAGTDEPALMRTVVERAVAVGRLERKHRRRLLQPDTNALPGVLGTSAVIVAACRQLQRVAPTDASVVLTGESGTGKEVMARAVHAASPRCSRRFVAINCAAIPETLLEAELFGYERGAFTGAVKQTEGRIELADRGTLFLDEIGDLPLSLQAKLLRFVQERVIERIGGRQEIAVDTRLICATNRDLPGLIKAGSFREDLFYRVSEIGVHLPPLRERDGDAVLLAQHFLVQYGGTSAQPLRGFSDAALHALDAHSWPGNIRELQNRVKRAVIMTDGPRILPRDLDLPDPDSDLHDLDLRRRREALELSVLRRVMARCDGNIAAAARLIGVSRPTLYDLLRQHGLRP
jgi:two-component system NtrC family response regulator